VLLLTELQLKSDHKPIEHLNDWKRKIVVMYTDKDPSHEDPNLVWRRDAIISIAEDKEVSCVPCLAVKPQSGGFT